MARSNSARLGSSQFRLTCRCSRKQFRERHGTQRLCPHRLSLLWANPNYSSCCRAGRRNGSRGLFGRNSSHSLAVPCVHASRIHIRKRGRHFSVVWKEYWYTWDFNSSRKSAVQMAMRTQLLSWNRSAWACGNIKFWLRRPQNVKRGSTHFRCITIHVEEPLDINIGFEAWLLSRFVELASMIALRKAERLDLEVEDILKKRIEERDTVINRFQIWGQEKKMEQQNNVGKRMRLRWENKRGEGEYYEYRGTTKSVGLKYRWNDEKSTLYSRKAPIIRTPLAPWPVLLSRKIATAVNWFIKKSRIFEMHLIHMTNYSGRKTRIRFLVKNMILILVHKFRAS